MSLADILGDRPQELIEASAGDRFTGKRRIVSSSHCQRRPAQPLAVSDFLPVQMLRAAGLHVLSALPPLRNIVMREGIEPGRGFKIRPSIFTEKLRR